MTIIKKISTQKSREEAAIQNVNIIEKKLILNLLQDKTNKLERDKLLDELNFWSDFIITK